MTDRLPSDVRIRRSVLSDAQRPIYITTPIYYVNDKPHIGHAYTTIVADYLARAFRLLGREVFYLTGTDEHGAKVAEVARANGMTPQQWCDLHAQHFRDTWKRLDIGYDHFIRTTDLRHVAGVQKMLAGLHEKKGPDGQPVVYEGTYTGLYCLGCEKFITEKELVDGLCPNHLTKPQEIGEKNYFFRLTAYLGSVEERIRSDKIRILPEARKSEVLGLFRQGLEDFSISREKVDWGIPLPWDLSQNAYVWVDALPNYITAVGYGDDRPSLEKWWTKGHVIHLMAKDILKFHAIYWPAMLLALGEKPPDELFIHGYFTVDGQKMSKSLGNVIDPNALVDTFGPDGARYLLLTQFPFGLDGDVKESEFVRQFNADLANDLGNLVSRVIALANRYAPGKQLSYHRGGERDLRLLGRASNPIATAVDGFTAGVDSFSPNSAISSGTTLVREINRWFDSEKPWKMAESGHHDLLEIALGGAAEATRVAAVILSPVIPGKSREILKALGFANPEAELSCERLREWGRPIGPFRLDAQIFPRLEKMNVQMERKLVTAVIPVAENVITIDQFRQAQLRTAEVLAAERVEGANKLLKLQIAIGADKRQIVAGIAQHYSPEDLVGRTIIVVANLQPTTIRGVVSQGMLLAASHGAELRLLTTDGPLPSGSSIS